MADSDRPRRWPAYAMALVTVVGRGVRRTLILVVLGVMTLAVVGGGGVMVLDGFIGLGVGWQWYHGVVGVVAITLSVEMFRSCAGVVVERPRRTERERL